LIPNEPSPTITRLAKYFPNSGRALDLAGGAGRHSIWLAERGLDVTLADVSTAGLELAERRAADTGVTIETCETDFEPDDSANQCSEFPPGPWHLILSHYYDCRALIPTIIQNLGPAGILIVVQPTEKNLERSPKPPRRFLLQEGELRSVASVASKLEIISYTEAWTDEDRHEATLVARRPASTT